MGYSLKAFDSKSAIGMREQVVSVYRSVYSLPPYLESENQIESFSKSWEARASSAGFLFYGALDEKDRLVGFSYGWQSLAGDAWNVKLSQQLGERSSQWLSDCFEFVDLAVDPSAQGSGLGRNLTKGLFDLVEAKTAVLMTHQTATKASAMYLRDGWVKLVENFEVAPGQFYQIMGKTL